MSRTTGAPEHEIDVEVAAREAVADGVVRLTLRPTAGTELPEWEPGAHLDLDLGPDLVRQYSLCGDRHDPETYQVAVLREPAGRGGSAHVHDAVEVGRVLRVRGPRNNFVLADSPRYLFLAGGIGITPIVPMIAEAEKAGADWRLIYGGRSRASMAFRDELVERYGDRVSLRPQDEVGLLDLEALLGTPSDGTLVYCCGPEALLRAVEERCAAWPSGALHVERFAPKEVPSTAEDGSFEVEFAQSGITVTVPPGVSIVDAAADAGVTIETSCREGTCGTCESAVLGGVPEHRDSLLTPEEQAENDVMFPCVSRAASEKLVIDR
ncbi:PDR/VanB family oxidoreductase [Pseudonocardia halophobica]|uniref:Ferredoxin n=1 Tax=Pseudonocardia halophobica TaxID=29401 RepID=A0A9W6UGN6_9PSEU|nr:PDR/VanB family oxidoreductase [Pseudonocardia halophobica]GLL16164.1 ferredoxin [Pseudonocardia halophobica]